MKRFEIGLVQQYDGYETDVQGWSILKDIFDEINEAYTTANIAHGFTLSKKIFKTDEDLDDFVKSNAYFDNALCFALGWNEFSKTYQKYEFNLRWNYGTILSPRLPQTEYEESSQNQLYLQSYANMGFL